MEALTKYVFRPFCIIFFLLGFACFLRPEAMSFIPFSWQGGFVIAMLPCGLGLFLGGAISAMRSSLKAKLLT